MGSVHFSRPRRRSFASRTACLVRSFSSLSSLGGRRAIFALAVPVGDGEGLQNNIKAVSFFAGECRADRQPKVWIARRKPHFVLHHWTTYAHGHGRVIFREAPAGATK
jgi:hypothetical protein